MPYFPEVPTIDEETNAYTIDFGDGVQRVVYDLYTHPTIEEAELDNGVHGEAWEQLLSDRFLYRHVLLPCQERALTGNLTLTDDDATYQMIDGNGSDRDVTLPTEFPGLNFFIHNISDTEVLTIKDDNAATVTTVSAGSFKTVIYTGTAWRAY